MKTIRLERMELRNFKGVAQADYVFGAHTDIRGGNATGKSTIFEAYLWCLFDKNQAGSTPRVQPLGKDNQPIHQLTTSVRLYLSLDGNPLIVERTLKEDWVKPRGTTELVCKGLKSEYAVNEVPMTKTQYLAKIDEILPSERWFTLSSIGIIPAMDQKTCRAALQAIAPAIDERALAKPYPAVAEALSEGRSIDELQAITKKSRTASKQELDGIPAAIDAQDRLRVEDDFDMAETELQVVESDLETLKAEMESLQTAGIDEDAQRRAEEQRRALATLNGRIAEWEYMAGNTYNTQRRQLSNHQSQLQAEAESIAQRIEMHKQRAACHLRYIEGEKKNIAALREEWMQKNAEVYQEPAIESVCPTCGQPLPEAQVNEARAKAQRVWNERKVAALQAIQERAEISKQNINGFAEQNEQDAAQDKTDAARLQVLREQMTADEAKISDLRTPEQVLQADEEYQAACKQRDELLSALNTPKTTQPDSRQERIADIKRQIAERMSKRDELTVRLAGRETNKRIDQERARLEERQSVLADIIAQAEGVEQQISDYRKAKIMAVENGVSDLFTMVRWKMYEPNLTNDGEKEICQAIIDGIPYDQQNRATQVNAAIDIVNGFTRAYEVSLPLFIDNAESVTDIIPTNGQCITMTVVKGSPLTLG